jgi:hypothetical protein
MGKKEKKAIALADEFQAMISMIPKLEAFIKIHHEITLGYQKYRKNGGEAIPGIEKHLGIKKQDSPSPVKAVDPKPKKEAEVPKKTVAVKKSTAAKS